MALKLLFGGGLGECLAKGCGGSTIDLRRPANDIRYPSVPERPSKLFGTAASQHDELQSGHTADDGNESIDRHGLQLAVYLEDRNSPPLQRCPVAAEKPDLLSDKLLAE